MLRFRQLLQCRVKHGFVLVAAEFACQLLEAVDLRQICIQLLRESLLVLPPGCFIRLSGRARIQFHRIAQVLSHDVPPFYR